MEYKRMAFALTGAPATFQHYVDNLLVAVKGTKCLVYLDNVIAFSMNFQQHAECLSHILQLFKDTNLKVNLGKCKFAQQPVKYSGHVVTGEGVKPDPRAVEAI